MRRRLSTQKRALIAGVLDDDAPSPTWINRFRESGTNALEATITINSLSATPSVRYRGCDATATEWPAWTYGDTLTLSGSGTAPTLQVPVPFVNNYDYGVKLVDGGKYYEAAASTTGDIATEDFICELILLPYTILVVQRNLVTKYNGADGWYLRDRGTATYPYFDAGIDVNGAGVTNPASDYIQPRGWCHVMWFFDRNAYYRCFINGQFSYGGALSTAATMTNDGKFRIGQAAAQSASVICYFAMWKRTAGWFTLSGTPSTDDNAANLLCRDRFQKLCGIWPQKALGTARPTTVQRAGQVYSWTRKIVSGKVAYFFLGGDQTASYSGLLSDDTSTTIVSRWGRIQEVLDGFGNAKQSLLVEPQAVNLCLRSQEFDNASWTTLSVNATITANTEAGPDNRTYADSLVEDATNGLHYIAQSITLTAANYAFSVFAKAGTRNFVELYVATLDAYAYFNLLTGAVGTTNNLVASGIEACIDGWYRCWISYLGTAAAYVHHIRAASADGTDSFAGTASAVPVYLYQAQVELGAWPTSPIHTTTGAATRPKDELVFPGGDNVGGASAFDGNISLRCHHAAVDQDANRTILCLSDGGDAADRIELEGLAASDVAKVTSGSGGVAITDATPMDVFDGNEHQIRVRARSADTALYVDGVMVGSSTTATTPTADCDEIRIGEDEAGGSQFGGGISEVRIYG